MDEFLLSSRLMTQTDYCKQTILETLQKTGEISSTDLNKVLKEEGYSRKAIDLAKPEPEKEGKDECFCVSANWQTPLAHPPERMIITDKQAICSHAH